MRDRHIIKLYATLRINVLYQYIARWIFKYGGKWEKGNNMRFIRQYLSRRSNAHTQKATLHLFLRICMCLNK